MGTIVKCGWKDCQKNVNGMCISEEIDIVKDTYDKLCLYCKTFQRKEGLKRD